MESYDEERESPVFRDGLWYQLLLVHDKQGLGQEYPVWDLGWFNNTDGVVMLSHLGGAAQQAGHIGPHEGTVSNVLEAWASLDYRAWLLPSDTTRPCLEYRDQTIFISDEDPR